jgi:hypothetical protein
VSLSLVLVFRFVAAGVVLWRAFFAEIFFLKDFFGFRRRCCLT